jgi:hypothetical protein
MGNNERISTTGLSHVSEGLSVNQVNEGAPPLPSQPMHDISHENKVHTLMLEKLGTQTAAHVH